MDRRFRIGAFLFRLICPEGIIPPPNFMLFEVDDGERYEYTYEIALAKTLTPPDGRVIARRPDLLVFQLEGGEGRLLGIKGIEGYYACYREVAADRAEVTLAMDRIRGLHIDPVFTSLLALERRMILKHNMVLHCAYVQYEGEAILFSAPSETGKTTQANLWEKYRRSRTINGDRALLGKRDGRWVAQGWPVCGTSEVCHNERIPIRAIVMLSQEKENHAERLTVMQAFTLLYGQITINRWNAEDNGHAMDLIMDLIENVPIYHLGCTISEEAVECLEHILYPGILT